MAVMNTAEMAGGQIDVPRAGRYRIDAENSNVTFTTRHLFGLAPVRGTFALRDGIIAVADPVDESAVHASVAASSFRTGNGARDATVLSRALLDAENYPRITFTSTAFARAQGEWLLRGELEVRSLTQVTEIQITEVGTETKAGETILRVRAQTEIDRYTFGITAYRGLAARRLTLNFEIVAKLEETGALR
jgi:polyisoprenoid-binding protein YceI